MEASSSPNIINSFVTTVIFNLNFRVLINLFFYSSAATTGVLTANKIITLVFEELLKIVHYKWIAKYKDKKDIAIEVIRICTEGSTTGWNIKPREIEHIYFIARLLEGVDKNAVKLFNQVITSWSLCAIMQDKRNPMSEDINFCRDLQRSAQEACEKLLGIVQNWR